MFKSVFIRIWGALFILCFICNIINGHFLNPNELQFEETIKLVYAALILSGLFYLGNYIFKLRKKDAEVEKVRFYVFGFIVLLFTAIYSVSFLGYDLQGVKKSAQESAKESKESAKESKESEKRTKSLKEETEEIARTTVEILNLATKARWQTNGGDLKSYNDLLFLQKNIENDGLQEIVREQIDLIQGSYNANTLWPAVDSLPAICQLGEPPCSKGLEPIEGFNAMNVYQHFTLFSSYKLWTEHARAASLIRNIRTSPNKDAVSMSDINRGLVELMRNENEKLIVRKVAFETYKYLNPKFFPKSSGVFDFDTAIEDWKIRAKSQ